MHRYQTELYGHLLEARRYDFGPREALIDGRPVRRSWVSAFLDRPIRFDLRNEEGAVHVVEVRWAVKPQSFGMRQQVRIAVDGVERAVLEPVPESLQPGRCFNCGYDLKGLPPQNGEVRCPECGRHTASSLLGEARMR